MPLQTSFTGNLAEQCEHWKCVVHLNEQIKHGHTYPSLTQILMDKIVFLQIFLFHELFWARLAFKYNIDPIVQDIF